MTADPLDVVRVEDLAPATVEAVIARLHSSTDFNHLVYREAELDALWSLADMAARRSEPHAERLVELLWSAHDLVGEGRPDAAAMELRQVLAQVQQLAQEERRGELVREDGSR